MMNSLNLTVEELVVTETNIKMSRLNYLIYATAIEATKETGYSNLSKQERNPVDK